MSPYDSERAIDSLGHWLVFWTVVVAVGLVVEYASDIKNFLVGGCKWLACSGERPKLTKTILGGLLITVGVASEGWIEFRASRVETQLRSENNRAFIGLETLASNAKTSAEGAADAAARAKDSADEVKHEVGEVSAEATAIGARLGNASRQLSALEGDVVAQGPRALLIKKVTPELIKQLTPFAGQKMEFFIWRENSSVYDRDALDTWGAIADVLGNDGAKWTIGHGGFTFLDTHLSAQGVIVFVNSRALKKTMDAARVLSEGLTKALPPSVNEVLAPVDPDFILPVLAQGLLNKDDPQGLVAQNAALIAVLIGEHPQKNTITKSTRHK